MARTTQRIVSIEYVADVSKFKKQLSDATKELKGLTTQSKNVSDSMNKIGNNFDLSNVGREAGKVAAVYSSLIQIGAKVGASVLEFGKNAIMSASDFNENMSKTQVVFGSVADSIIAKSTKMASATGLSANQFLEQMGLWGSMAQAMGVPNDKMLEMSDTLTKLSADMSSFHNKDVEQVRTALKGVFTGETEALKEFGVVMTETNLEEFARSIGTTTKNMTQAEKVQLRYNFVLNQQKLAIGDYQRTNTGFANSFRTLKANIENVGVSVGQKLLPWLENAITTLNNTIDGLGSTWDELNTRSNESSGRIATIKNEIAKLGEQGITSGEQVDKLNQALSDEINWSQNIEATKAIKANIEAWLPAIQIIGGALATILTLYGAIKTVMFITNAATVVWNTLLAIGAGISAIIGVALSPITLIILAIVAAIGLVIAAFMNWNTIVTALTDAWNWFVNACAVGLENVKNFFINVWNSIVSFFSGIVNGILNWYRFLWNTATGIFNSFKDGLIASFNVIVNAFKNAWNGITGFFSNLWNGILETFKNIWNNITGTVQGWVSNLNPMNWFKGVNLDLGNAEYLLQGNAVNLPGNNVGNKTVYNYNMYTNQDISLGYIQRQKAIVEGGQAYNFNR